MTGTHLGGTLIDGTNMARTQIKGTHDSNYLETLLNGAIRFLIELRFPRIKPPMLPLRPRLRGRMWI